MAIKSKSLLKSKGLKIAAVLLVLILAGVFALSIGQVSDFGIELGGGSIGSMLNQGGGSIDTMLNQTEGDFTGSSMFQQELEKNVYYMRQMAFVYRSEEAVRDGSALREQETLLERQKEKELKEQLESARQEKADGGSYNAQYNFPYEEEESTTAPATTDASGAPTAITLTAEEKASIIESIDEKYKEQRRALRINFDETYRRAKEGLAKLTNLHYLLINRETGALYTNLEGSIDPATTDLRSLVEKYGWNESYTEQYRYHAGKRVETEDRWYPLYNTSGFYRWGENYSDRMTLYEKEFVEKGWDIYIGLNDTLVSGIDEFSAIQDRFETAKRELPIYLALAGGSLLLALAITIYLIAASGRRAGRDDIVLIWTDRIPNDLHLLMAAALALTGIAGAAGTLTALWNSEHLARDLWMLGTAALGVAIAGVLLEWVMSAARNVKRRQYWRDTLVVKLLRLMRKGWRRFRIALRNVREDIREHAVPKHSLENLRASILFLFVGYLLINVILIAITMLVAVQGAAIPFLFLGVATALFNIFVLISIWKSVIALDQIMTAVAKTRQGDLSYPLQTARMPRLLRTFGEDVVCMQDGMRAAVDEAIKGEHMKTELITNVSHDLKTPLTAIVNYVDLLKKCDISDEAAQGYIGVLEEKSERLKHLIEDLVEASKATTGNIQLNFIKVNLFELAIQAVGESEDAMEAAGLTVRLNTPEREPILRADSQKTWRIIDNLISNVKKYAMPGTRVYIDVGEEDGYGLFSIKNISREPLDVPVEALTQRFVRGDASRSTEGSGLGLSIAQSLCELQHGTLDISLDGDLFKVSVRIPLDQTNG